MKAIIFDFDGTLADSGDCGFLATQKAFEEMNLPEPSRQQIDYYMGIPIEQSFQELSNHQLNEEQFTKLLSEFRAAYKKIEEQTLTVFPQIHEVLQNLQSLNFSLFVVSSKKSDVLFRNLQNLNLTHYFTDWIGSDQVSHYKPHPEGILQIFERHGLNPGDCVMVGDAIFDLQMGKAANCKTVGVAWGSHSKLELLKEEPTFFADQVIDLMQIPQLF